MGGGVGTPMGGGVAIGPGSGVGDGGGVPFHAPPVGPPKPGKLVLLTPLFEMTVVYMRLRGRLSFPNQLISISTLPCRWSARPWPLNRMTPLMPLLASTSTFPLASAFGHAETAIRSVYWVSCLAAEGG